jgi:hypothetical protein
VLVMWGGSEVTVVTSHSYGKGVVRCGEVRWGVCYKCNDIVWFSDHDDCHLF